MYIYICTIVSNTDIFQCLVYMSRSFVFHRACSTAKRNLERASFFLKIFRTGNVFFFSRDKFENVFLDKFGKKYERQEAKKKKL